MADIVSPTKRSQMMAGIKAKNTKPELLIRKSLHSRGFRYRLHVRNLPGKPDLVFTKYDAVLFIHGCFWHGHSCHLFKWPSSRVDFWKQKLTRNKQVDAMNIEKLLLAGWRVGIIWECSLKGKKRKNLDLIAREIGIWLHSNKQFFQIGDNI